MKHGRYPKIHIRSKNELAKHISSRRLPVNKVKQLINDVNKNYDSYWRDHPKYSQPEKGKLVRDASGTNLGKMLKLINKRILKPHDTKLPNFIFGGISGLDHKSAVAHLLGDKRKRVLLKLDITRFYEQIEQQRVYHFFRDKCECSHKAASLLANICCVPYGPKEKPENYKTIGRGFSPSSRLAVWCNLDTFIKLEQLVQKELKGKDPRIAIYVDDIGITASKATKEDMMKLYEKIKKVLASDRNQMLPLNDDKTKIIFHSGETYDLEGIYQGKWGFEHMGVQMNRNSLTLGSKTRWKLVNLTEEWKNMRGNNLQLKKSRKSILRYKRHIEE